jgi:thymidylate synthase
MNKLDLDYQNILKDILENGVEKKDRTGTGTISVFGRQIRHKMSDGFPLLTTKKMPFKTIVTELLWFLRGDTNIKFLIDNNCHIWDGDAYKNFIKTYEGRDGEIILPPDDYINDNGELISKEEFINKIKTDDEFAKAWGELGPIYGKQWRKWKTRDTKSLGGTFWGPTTEITENSIDQIANLINDLKTNPDSRRLMVNAWNVGELDQMTLPPCHYGFQVYTRELTMEEKSQYKRGNKETYPVSKWRDDMGISKEEYFNQIGVPTRAISLMWNQRSVDTFLGLPFNIASYGLLLEIIAKVVNMVPDELIGNLGDTHLYLNHIEQAKEQIGRELSLEEKTDWLNKNYPLYSLGEWAVEKLSDKDYLKEVEVEYNIPKRTREPYPLPLLDIHPGILDYDMEKYPIGLFEIKDYQSHPTIKAPLSN